MTEDRYRIVFAGDLVGDTRAEAAIGHLVETFGLSEGKARRLVLDGHRHVLKSDLEATTAERYRRALYQAGLRVRVEPMAAQPEHLELTPLGEVPPDDGEAPRCPACGSGNLADGVCRDCGMVRAKYPSRRARLQGERDDGPLSGPSPADPYAAPRADLSPAIASGRMTGPRRVSAGHGLAWIARGFWHFKTNPWTWILALIVLTGINLLASLVPLFGWLLPSLLAPAFTAGLMLGAREQEQGRPMLPGHIFAGFGEHAGRLTLVGVLYLSGFILITVLMVLVMMVAAVPMMAGLGDPEVLAAQDPQVVMETMGPALMLGALVGALFFVPLLMALIFAPALVVMDGLAPLDAMRQSFTGCLRNWQPFLVYGLIGLLLILVGALPLGLGLLVVGPTLWAAIYVAYRDVYYG